MATGFVIFAAVFQIGQYVGVLIGSVSHNARTGQGEGECLGYYRTVIQGDESGMRVVELVGPTDGTDVGEQAGALEPVMMSAALR